MNFKFGNNPPVDGRSLVNLTRQSSVYSLTFNEFQNTMGSIGTDFGSMNMDELLKNIWTAEETQNVASSIAASKESAFNNSGGYLQKQGSLTLPRTLSQKTVDEVWKNMAKEHGDGSNIPQAQTQQTLGEITLEEFLFRAGVVNEDTQAAEKPDNEGFFGFQQQVGKMNGMSENNNRIQIQSFSNLPLNVNDVQVNQQQQHQQQIFPKQALGIGNQGANNSLIQGCLGAGVTVATGLPAGRCASEGVRNSNGDTSSVSPVPYVFNGGLRGRKSSAVEKVVERRQRRMIKNRESAARSRARKQAYTMELEAEVAKLKEENEKLQKKQEQIMEMQKNQAMEMMEMQRGGKKRCLRRTQTGPW